MKIRQALFVPGRSAFFFDDQAAIKKGAVHDGFTYRGRPATPGFKRIREAGDCISVLLLLDNGAVAVGDCAAVQYSGAGGRDPLFRASTYLPLLRKKIGPSPALRGFSRHGLGAVLAKLEGRCVVAIGPGTAGAIKPIGLVGRQQGLRALEGDVLAQQRVLHAVQSAPATGRAFVKLNFFLFHRRLPD